ncbi:MAG: MBL fold metallo-hydrolase [Deltaproteobacteria bacterium]|nr:MBL fold metallo-hydrolase [Deltaproteobacteria bacterium]
MEIKAFYDPTTFTLTYVVFDPATRDAVIIDPVLDYDPASVSTSTASLEKLYAFIDAHQLRVHYILETHAHADHLSGALELKNRYVNDAKIAIGERITRVQKTFKSVFNFPESFHADGSQFDRLWKDGETVRAGSLAFLVLFTPGHTPACVSYLCGDAVFTGDALFMPDYGTGRCDFPNGDSKALFHSITERLYKLPESTRVFVGHDYQPNGRELAYETTIGASKNTNVQLRATTTESEFVAFRDKRDATLAAPRLLFPSVQVNIAAGKFPEPESNGTVYLKLPVKKAK